MAEPEEQLVPVEGGPRLMISKMVLENFKSYAGAITIGPFNQNMTSVVGPNGSGKSNVIDAMLFVFGWRAKQMRQSKLAELIHSSDQHPDLQHCQVSVHFQDIIDQPDGSYTVVEGSELVVSREARRDSSSRYSVDGKTSNFGDVTKLLKKRGIDLDHNRFLILQGEVEQIAMMKPKAPSPHEDGLLEYLEDIIGSNKHVEPINEAHKAIEELNEQRATKLNSLKAVEQQMGELEERKAEADAYMRAESQLHERQSAFYQKNMAECQEIIEAAEAKRDELQARLQDEKSKAKENVDQLSVLEKAYKKGKKEHDKVAAQLEKSRTEFQAFEREDIKNREELKHQKTQLKKAQAALEKDAKKLSTLQHEVSTLQADIPRLEEEEQTLTKVIQEAEKDLEAMYDGLKSTTEPLRKKIEAKQAEREPKAQALTALQSREQLAKGEIQLLTDKVSGGATALQNAEQDLRNHDETVERSRQELDLCKGALETNTKELEAIEARKAPSQQREAALVEEQRVARARHEEGNASRSTSSTRSGQLDALMKAKAKGAIPGVIGRLGALGSIAPEFDVAISTACGPLDHVVVADTNAAQQCVELLRKQQLGVCTFIALDRQQHLRERMNPIKAPQGSQRLFDLVKCDDPEHRVAFYYALADTLVCEDKQLASQIATGGTKRWRVVTTDGVVINASGTMEGGGKPMVGRMGAKGAKEALSEKELAALRARAESASKELDELRASRAADQENERKLQKEVSKQRTLLKKLSMQLDAAAEQKAAFEQRVKQTRGAGQLTDDENARKEQLQEELRELQREGQKQQEVVSKADAALAVVQEQVLAVGGIKLRAQKSKVETLGEQLAGTQQSVTKAKVDAESRAAAEKKLKTSMTKQEAAIGELEQKAEKTKAHFKTLEDEAYGVMQQFEQCQADLNTQEEALKGMQDEYEAFKSVVAKVRTVEVELNAQIEDQGRAAKDHQQKAKHWSHKLKALRETASASATLTGAAEEDGSGQSSTLLPELTEEELVSLDLKELQADITQLEEAIQAMNPNLSVIAEYYKRETERRTRQQDFDTVTEQRDGQRLAYEELRKLRLAEFMKGFGIIGMRLKEMYQMITLGGDAELELVDSLDPFTEGIVFSVRPPKKSWKNIANLSGGEKTLSSLALVFALHHYKPTPLYVMDEIDAALDFRNVSIVGNYIKERTRNAQFIIISLRNNMFELADRLVGVYKTQNQTKSIAIDPAAFTIGASS